MDEKNVFFVGRANIPLGEEIVHLCEYEISPIEYTKFADGEYKAKLGANVRNKNVFIIQPTNATISASADNFFELVMLTDAAKRASAAKVNAVIPYFGNARQERKDEARTPITAKLCTKLLEAAGIDRIITMDLHADAIQGFFEIPVDNLYASYLFAPLINKIKTPDLMFASADSGGAKRVASYAKYFDAEMVVCYKDRKKANEVDKVMVIGDPNGKDIIIIEDIIDTGGTICKVSNALKEKGAKSVQVFSTHGVLSGDAYDNIMKSEIDMCYVTDSLKKGKEYLSTHDFPKLQIVPSADLFAKAIRRNIQGKSVKELFLF